MYRSTGLITVGPVTTTRDANMIDISHGRPAIKRAEIYPTVTVTITASVISLTNTDLSVASCLISRESPPSKRIIITKTVIIILKPLPRDCGFSIPVTPGPAIIPMAK